MTTAANWLLAPVYGRAGPDSLPPRCSPGGPQRLVRDVIRRRHHEDDERPERPHDQEGPYVAPAKQPLPVHRIHSLMFCACHKAARSIASGLQTFATQYGKGLWGGGRAAPGSGLRGYGLIRPGAGAAYSAEAGGRPTTARCST